MEFNYAQEGRKFERQWKILRKQYQEAGMDEEAISKMYQFDLQWLNSERRYIRRQADLPVILPHSHRHPLFLLQAVLSLLSCPPVLVSSLLYSFFTSLATPSVLSLLSCPPVLVSSLLYSFFTSLATPSAQIEIIAGHLVWQPAIVFSVLILTALLTVRYILHDLPRRCAMPASLSQARSPYFPSNYG